MSVLLSLTRIIIYIENYNSMEKQKLIEKINSVKDISKDYNLIYEVLDELGISYKKTTCHKCRRDLLNIAKEELELIEDASEFSGWDNSEFTWIYHYPRPVRWGDKVITKKTPQHILQDFCKEHPKLCIQQSKIKFK